MVEGTDHTVAVMHYSQGCYIYRSFRSLLWAFSLVLMGIALTSMMTWSDTAEKDKKAAYVICIFCACVCVCVCEGCKRGNG